MSELWLLLWIKFIFLWGLDANKPFYNHWRSFPQYRFGNKKANPIRPSTIAPGTHWETVTICGVLLRGNKYSRAGISKVSGGSPAVIYSFEKIQLLPEIQSGKSVDTKCPARASLSLHFEMQQNRRKYWLQLRHSPGTQDLQLWYLNLYIFMYFIFFLNLP